MELSLGQYGAAGPIMVWKCCPLLKGKDLCCHAAEDLQVKVCWGNVNDILALKKQIVMGLNLTFSNK